MQITGVGVNCTAFLYSIYSDHISTVVKEIVHPIRREKLLRIWYYMSI